MAMDKDTLVKWLTDYYAYWSTLPAPEDFLTWDAIGQSIDDKLKSLQTTLNDITDDQLKALATFLDEGDNGDPKASPAIPATPPQPYIIKQIALCIIAGPIWIAQRLNHLLPTAGNNAGIMNWMFTEYSSAVSSAKTWYLSKGLQTPIGDMLDLWAHGSDADLKKQYPDATNIHSIDTIGAIMKLTTMLDDGSANNKVSDPTPQYISDMTNAIISAEAN